MFIIGIEPTPFNNEQILSLPRLPISPNKPNRKPLRKTTFPNYSVSNGILNIFIPAARSRTTTLLRLHPGYKSHNK